MRAPVLRTAAAPRLPVAALHRLVALVLLVALAAIATASRAAIATGMDAFIQVETGTHSAPIRGVSVDEALGLVITVSDDKSARVWDLATGAVRQIVRPTVGLGKDGGLYAVAFDAGSKRIAFGGSVADAAGRQQVFLADPSTGAINAALPVGAGEVRALAWSPDGSVLAITTAGDNALRAFSAGGALLHETRFKSPAYAIAVSRDGRIAAASLEGELVLLQAAGGRVGSPTRLDLPRKEVRSLSFSPDGRRIAVGYTSARHPPEIIDAATGREIRALQVPKLVAGYLEIVVWSKDGARVHAGGRGYERTSQEFSLFQFDAGSGALLARTVVASNSIRALVPLADGRVVYGAFDGTWGAVKGDRVTVRGAAAVSDLRGPEHLKLDPGGRSVAWSVDDGRSFTRFDFDSRRLVTGRGAPAGLREPRIKNGVFDSPVWRNERKPVVNGNPIALAADETSRSLCYFAKDAGGAVIGTNRRLVRLDPAGRALWDVPIAGDVWGVNISDDDRLVVSTHADGTLRWWNASDGALLVTLFAAADGRWLAWTEEGFYDASGGADNLAGWVVRRQDGLGATFHALGRFRERYHKPTVIDGTLRVLGARQAAIAAGVVPPQAAEGRSLRPVAFPPALERVGDVRLVRDGTAVEVAFKWLSTGGRVDVEARVNGRPPQWARFGLPSRREASGNGTVELPLPPDGGLIQVYARDEFGASEPLAFTYEAPQPTSVEPNAGASPAAPGPFVAPGPLAAPGPPAAAGTAPVFEPPRIATAAMAVATTPIVAATAAATPAAAPADRGPEPRPAPGADGKPRLFVLAIGVSKYDRKDYQLQLAAKDALDFAALMRAQAGRLYASAEVRTLTDAQASRAAILTALAWLENATGPKDTGVLFLAGHGVDSPDSNYYFMPRDADHRDLARTGVPETAFRRTLGQMKGKAVMFLDTCFGGAVLKSAGSRELSRLASELASTENGVVVFASSSGRQESLENDAWGNGAFTLALLGGLAGKADFTRSGRVTFKGLDKYVSDEVIRLTEGKQTPVTIVPVGIPDFTLTQL